MRTPHRWQNESRMSYYKDGYEDGKSDTIKAVLEIIKEYKSYHNGAHWTLLKEISERIKGLTEENT